MSIDLADDGYEKLTLRDSTGKVVWDKDLDLWEIHNTFVDIQNKYKGRPAQEFHAAVVEHLAKMGFPPVSHRFADQLIVRVRQRVAELKNAPAGEPVPGSPASTASIPSH